MKIASEMARSMRFLGPYFLHNHSGFLDLEKFSRQRSALRFVSKVAPSAACYSTWIGVLYPGFSKQLGGPLLVEKVFCGNIVSSRAGLAGDNSGLDSFVRCPEFFLGEEGVWSIVIPTYDRLPILCKCLDALEEQTGFEGSGIKSYEVIVVDDGSTDGTVDFLQPVAETGSEDKQSQRYPHVKVVRQKHAGATKARNLGIRHARGATIVFIDSDLVVTQKFLKSHADAMREAVAKYGDDRAFTYGRVVNTANFENPRSEPFKMTDMSAAFFATGNVAISRKRLLDASKLVGGEGPFDADFSEYGWEDLELGERLRQGGARIQHAPAAVGYHWHPAFDCEQIPRLIEQERQRGRNGVRFYRKHPNLNVRLMIQMTPFHDFLWFLLTLGGLVNERTLEPLLRHLVACGQPGLAGAFLSPVLNWHTVQAVKEEAKRLKREQQWIR